MRWNFQGQTAGGVFPDLVFFAPIFRPNYAVPCLTAYISGTKSLRRLKFGAFIVHPECKRPHPRHRPHRPPFGKGAPSKIGKNWNFRKLSRNYTTRNIQFEWDASREWWSSLTWVQRWRGWWRWWQEPVRLHRPPALHTTNIITTNRCKNVFYVFLFWSRFYVF